MKYDLMEFTKINKSILIEILISKKKLFYIYKNNLYSNKNFNSQKKIILHL